MNRRSFAIAAVTGLTALSLACQGLPASAPLAPSGTTTAGQDVAGAGPDGTSLKATVPAVQSPTGNPTTASLTPTLVASAATLKYSSGAVQYRFRVTDDTGTVTADSGLQNTTSWTLPAPLTPTSKYTWVVRAEYRGLVGAWSTSGTFTTPTAPVNDYGPWEATCQGIADRAVLVGCVWNFVQPTNSVQDFEVAKRVAWLLRADGGGLLLKGSGENTVPWLGFTFSASRICFPDGHIFKIIGDSGPGGTNTPGYGDNDFTPTPETDYFPARDPRLR